MTIENTVAFARPELNFQIAEITKQVGSWVNIQATNLLAGFNGVMAAGRDLTGAALDQFLDFAAQHPTVAMLTKAASEMPLPKPGNGNDFQELLWTLGGAGLGLITFSILEKKDFNSNRPARFIDKIIYQAFGFGVGGLFGYCFYHNLNDR